MIHIKFDLNAIYEAPISCKIMGILILKNFGIGLYQGIQNFRTHERPVTQFIDNVISYSLWGCVEAFFWPLSFSYMITYELDKVANYMMVKEMRRD